MVVRTILALVAVAAVGDGGLQSRLEPSQCLEPCSVKVRVEVPTEVPLRSEFCVHVTDDRSIDTTSCWPMETHRLTLEINKIWQGVYGIEVSVDGRSNTQTLTVHGANP